MRIPFWITLIAALLALSIVVVIGRLLINPNLPLIVEAKSSLEAISPNADGLDDVTDFTYKISRNALVSLVLEDTNGQVYVFREDEHRIADEYRVQFSGVVDGYMLPDEQIGGEVLRRLIPDGAYTWTLQAIAENDGEIMEISGALTVQEADSPLPEIIEFTVYPPVFTPNQDGVDDRTQVNVGLAKDAALNVYLVDSAGREIFMPRREEGRQEGEAGRQIFDYEGGVDIGADPPPDGTYTVVARAQDDEGQIVQNTTMLTIAQGGKPRAEIVAQPTGPTVVFITQPYAERYATSADVQGDLIDLPEDAGSLSMDSITMPVGDLLVFRLTVENYSPAPIRTTGPAPGTVYQQDQVAASVDAYESSGAWRVGIQCETSSQPYPWRWAIGNEDTLQQETAANGDVFYYLLPGERSVVWGAIRMTDLIEAQNPQYCWAGLIHEDVEITLQNSNVGPREIELVTTEGDSAP